MKSIPVGTLLAKVDDGDYEDVSSFKWSLARRGKKIYAQTHPPGTERNSAPILMHHLIMDSVGIDHKNGDGLDNQRANLRSATHSQNGANRGKIARQTSSKYKGVVWDSERSRWRAQIRVNNKNRMIGRFTTEEEAAKAYDSAALAAWGEFAFLNFSIDQQQQSTTAQAEGDKQ